MVQSVSHETSTVAALFVETGGCYFGLEGVDPWDQARDARRYPGSAPVVAHPPCQRWCQLAYVNQARYGQAVGEDAGCFEAALEAVRQFGGVLEHPAYSHAWRRFGLLRPPRVGGWVPADLLGGWAAHVEQGQYGHRARKATWLYAFGTGRPALRWGPGPAPKAWVSTDRPRAELKARGLGQLMRGESGMTTPAFRDALLSIARSAA